MIGLFGCVVSQTTLINKGDLDVSSILARLIQHRSLLCVEKLKKKPLTYFMGNNKDRVLEIEKKDAKRKITALFCLRI